MESLNFQFGQSDYNYLARKLGSNQTTRISPSEFSSFLFSWKQTEEPEQEVVVGGDSHLKFNYRPFTVSQRSPVTMATPISMSAKKPANSPPQIITNLSSTNPSTTAPQIQEEQFYSPKSILPKSPRSIFSSVPSSAVKNVVITSSLASPKNYPPPVFESKYTTPSKIDLQAHQVLSEPQPDHQVPSVRSTYQRPQTTATTSVRSTYQQNYQRPQISITSAPLAKINEHRETATTVRSSHHINETPRVSALQNNNYLDAKSAQFASENLKKRDLISKSRALRIESNNTKNVSLESNNPEIKRNSHATSIFAPRKYEKEVENQRYSNYQEQPTSVRASAKPEIKTFEFPTTPSYTSSIKNINQDPYNQLSVRNSNLTDKYGLGESPFRFYSPKFSGQNPLIHQSLNLQSSKFNPKFEQSSTTSRPSQNLESKRFYEPPKVESNFYSYQNGELKYEPAPSNNRQFYKETYSKQLF